MDTSGKGFNNWGRLWYSTDDGEFHPLGDVSGEFTFSLDVSEESAAELAHALEPLGELEIVPRDDK